jgi:hypothetical protein
MDKYTKLELRMKKIVTVDILVDTIVDIMNEMTEGKYSPSTQVGAVWTLRDVVEVQGFYLIEDIIRDLVSACIGRLFRMAVIDEGINLETPMNIKRITAMLDATYPVEEAALPLIIERATTVIGIPAFIALARKTRVSLGRGMNRAFARYK